MTETSGAITLMIKGSRKYDSVVGPIPNTEMKVVNPETQSSLPARQTGEICMRGPQVRERARIAEFTSICTYFICCYFMGQPWLPLPVRSLIELT